ncbi:FkbM family methyltransferase [Crocinitomix catalasitica]|uniref:FkbM family methyltransferase n=1 Tax=Crocinitomix catalasitica TaxID=184607 RepID=UPI000487C78F|nr:FkbM family methyltransferase [Crocinitomix catalasitica]
MLKRILNKLGIYRVYPLNNAGKKFRIPIFNGLGFANLSDAEPWMDDLLKEFGSTDTNFLDVVVNVGQTLIKWKAPYPSATYTGFEPNYNCVKYVEDLITKNEFENCTINPYALDTQSSKKKLYLLGRDKSDSSASMLADFRSGEDRMAINIETSSLAALGLNNFDLVKIDVEGAELFVLQSLFEVCQNAIISCEILPAYNLENSERIERQQEIEKLLSLHNYAIFRVQKTQPIRIESIEEFGIHGELSKSDYIFIPKDRINQFKHLLA